MKASMYILTSLIFLSTHVAAQDLSQIQAEMNQIKKVVAMQQALSSTKKTKIWRKSLPAGIEYGFGQKAVDPSLRASFIQVGKWYRVTIEGIFFGTASVTCIDGAPRLENGVPLNDKITAIATIDKQVENRYISSSALWQAKSGEFNVYFNTSDGDNAGYILGQAQDKTFTITIEEVDVSVQNW